LKRIIKVVVHVGAVKIYVAAVEAFSKQEKTGVTQKTIQIKIEWFSEFHPVFLFYVLFSRFFENITLFMTKLKVLVVAFPNFMDNSSL
jgi:hypothetical protein